VRALDPGHVQSLAAYSAALSRIFADVPGDIISGIAKAQSLRSLSGEVKSALKHLAGSTILPVLLRNASWPLLAIVGTGPGTPSIAEALAVGHGHFAVGYVAAADRHVHRNKITTRERLSGVEGVYVLPASPRAAFAQKRLPWLADCVSVTLPPTDAADIV